MFARIPAGRIGRRGDREIVHVPNVYVLFLAPSRRPETYFLAGGLDCKPWTSMTRRVLEKNCAENVCTDFLVPSNADLVVFLNYQSSLFTPEILLGNFLQSLAMCPLKAACYCSSSIGMTTRETDIL